jgi:hypothetical protein
MLKQGGKETFTTVVNIGINCFKLLLLVLSCRFLATWVQRLDLWKDLHTVAALWLGLGAPALPPEPCTPLCAFSNGI